MIQASRLPLRFRLSKKSMNNSATIEKYRRWVNCAVCRDINTKTSPTLWKPSNHAKSPNTTTIKITDKSYCSNEPYRSAEAILRVWTTGYCIWNSILSLSDNPSALKYTLSFMNSLNINSLQSLQKLNKLTTGVLVLQWLVAYLIALLPSIHDCTFQLIGLSWTWEAMQIRKKTSNYLMISWNHFMFIFCDIQKQSLCARSVHELPHLSLLLDLKILISVIFFLLSEKWLSMSSNEQFSVSGRM